MIQTGDLSFGHAKAIMAISEAATQIMVSEEVVRRLLSVRETEQLVARTTKAVDADKIPPRGQPAEAEDPNVKAAEEGLRTRLATKVRIIRRGSGSEARGRIEIEFYSDEELDRLYSIIMDRGR